MCWVSTNPEKLVAVKDFPVPNIPKSNLLFPCVVGIGILFLTCQKFAEIAELLNLLLRSENDFIWGPSQSQSFEKLKSIICSSFILAFPDFKKPFILRKDASDYGLGAVLSQTSHDGHERPIAFASRSLSKCERNYHATEKACLVIIWDLKKFEHYLDGQEFKLETDNRALVW
jgi:hypothetical protein